MADIDNDVVETSDVDGEEGGSGSDEKEKIKIEWKECKLDELYNQGVNGLCADIEVPADWNDPDGSKITVRVKRTGRENAERQLFMLQGGPGGSSTLYFGSGEVGAIGRLDEKVEFIMMDQRGCGYSTFLKCPQLEDGRLEPNEVAGCITHLEENGIDVRNFSTNQAAADLQRVMELMADDGVKQYVYGVSYGTYLALRHAHLYPEAADGYIMIGLVPPEGMPIDRYDTRMEDMAATLMQRCEDDEFCKSKFGEGNVPEKIREISSKFRAKEICKGMLDGTALAGYPSYFPFVTHEVVTRVPDLFPALFYRIQRCEERDIAVVRNLLNAFYGARGMRNSENPRSLYMNQIVANTIKISELVGNDPMTIQEAMDQFNTSTVNAMHDYSLLSVASDWPRYEDPLKNEWPEIDAPILMMNGTMDFQTPFDYAVKYESQYPEGYFVELPDGGHGLMTIRMKEGSVSCDTKIFADFLKNPDQKPDTSCLEEVQPLNFERQDRYTQHYFGVKDIWED